MVISMCALHGRVGRPRHHTCNWDLGMEGKGERPTDGHVINPRFIQGGPE